MGFDNRVPVGEEHPPLSLRVTGRIPDGLRGTLFRNEPNPCKPEPAAHWFMGDGMVHAFTIGPDGVTYANRWIRTQSWAQANGTAAASLPAGVANTSIVSHAGRLLALEEAHMPVAFAPDTLATLGKEDFSGRLPTGPFTAHPKRDGEIGALVFFGYGLGGPAGALLRNGEITQDGAPGRLRTIEAPYAAMVHDFAVTRRHIAIPLFPLLFDRGCGFRWQPGRGAFLGVMDRAQGVGSLRWIPAGAGFAFHVMNAWEEDETLSIDLMLSEAPSFFPGPTGIPTSNLPARLVRWSVDLRAAPGIACHPLSALEGEFPRIDERVEGRRNRHGCFVTGGGIVHRDDLTGVERSFTLPKGDSPSEAVFLPRCPEEGNGWLLCVVFRGSDRQSDLVILDATEMSAAPLAVAHLASRVPAGFHGTWVGAAP